MEDDIIGSDYNIEFLIGIINQLSGNELLVCGGQDGISSTKYVYGKETTIERVWSLASFSHYQIARSCCYLISRKIAQKFLSQLTKSVLLADDWGSLASLTNTKVSFINLFSHPIDVCSNNSSQSNIELERSNLPNFKRANRTVWELILGTNKKSLRHLVPLLGYKPFKEMI